MNTQISFKSLADRWPSAFVAREKIGVFTGYILSPKTCANLDSQGKGIEGRVKVGGKVCYPVDSVIKFIESKAKG